MDWTPLLVAVAGAASNGDIRAADSVAGMGSKPAVESE